ncbi:PPC domain-containing protein [soil metagenome]
MKNVTLAFILLVICGGTTARSVQRFPAEYPITSKRVKFLRGHTTAVIRGVARTPGIYEYVLKARAGQTMTVHLTSSNNGVEFTIFGPNGDEPEGALGVDDWSGTLEASGDYKITLINNRSRISRKPSYTLEVNIR